MWDSRSSAFPSTFKLHRTCSPDRKGRLGIAVAHLENDPEHKNEKLLLAELESTKDQLSCPSIGSCNRLLPELSKRGSHGATSKREPC
jgi:hypothetical protein